MYTTLPAALFIWAISQVYALDDSSIISFEFNAISMTSCNPSKISWVYSAALGSTATEMFLTITNDGVQQVFSQSLTTTGSFTVHPRLRRDDPVTASLTDSNGVDPAAHQFTWSNVTVPPGFYVLEATFPLQDTTFNSSSFLVSDGCSATTSSTPTSTISSSASPSPSSSSSTFPVDAASSKKVSRGAIAGGVIGGLAVIAAAIAAYFYLRFASASSGASPRKRSPSRKWGGLGSFDGKSYPSASRGAAGAAGAANRHHSQTDSVGPMLDNNVYVIGSVGIDSRPSRIHDNMEADEDVDSYFSPSQEKISSSHGSPMRSPFSDSGHIDLDDVPMDLISSSPAGAASNITRSSSTSTASYMNNNNFSRPRSHPSSPHSESPFSNPARNTTTSTLGQSDPSAYAPSPSPAYPSGTSQTLSETVKRTSTGEPVPAPATGTGSGSRRTPRKPVPQYNPTDPALMPLAARAVAVSRPVPAQPVPQAAVDSEANSRSSSREGSVRAGGQQREDWPNLSHKASFGAEGRAVHYLMPDMPLPQPRD